MTSSLTCRSLILLSAVLLAASGCGSGSGTTSQKSTATKATAASPTPLPTSSAPESPTLPTFTVANGKVDGPKRITAKVGDEVSFLVTADKRDEVHVHTYDVTVDIAPGKQATVRVQADIPGVFEIELEESHLLLTQLRVSP